MKSNHSIWLESYIKKSSSVAVKARLLCLHHLGSNARFCSQWPNSLPDGIEVVSLKLPGRERRMSEQPILDWKKLISEFVSACSDFLKEKPYIVLGNSMGCWIGYEIVSELQRRGGPLPIHYIACAASPPHKRDKSFKGMPKPWKESSDDEIVEYLKSIGGSEELVKHKELLDFFLPVFRADGQLVEDYWYTKGGFSGEKIDVSITFYGSSKDEYVVNQQSWGELTTKEFDCQMNEGTHLFLLTPTLLKPVLQKVQTIVENTGK